MDWIMFHVEESWHWVAWLELKAESDEEAKISQTGVFHDCTIDSSTSVCIFRDPRENKIIKHIKAQKDSLALVNWYQPALILEAPHFQPINEVLRMTHSSSMSNKEKYYGSACD